MHCSILGCSDNVNARQMCKRHYSRWIRTGDPENLTNVRQETIEERFWRNVKTTENPDECWVWTASKPRGGYGAFTFLGTYWMAHRYSWVLHNPDQLLGDKKVLHRCDNPPCCNPNHLFLGTTQDNSDDMVAKKRHVFAEGHPMAKLNWDKVHYVRTVQGKTQKEIAEIVGVTQAVVSKIQLGVIWNV